MPRSDLPKNTPSGDAPLGFVLTTASAATADQANAVRMPVPPLGRPTTPRGPRRQVLEGPRAVEALSFSVEALEEELQHIPGVIEIMHEKGSLEEGWNHFMRLDLEGFFGYLESDLKINLNSSRDTHLSQKQKEDEEKKEDSARLEQLMQDIPGIRERLVSSFRNLRNAYQELSPEGVQEEHAKQLEVAMTIIKYVQKQDHFLKRVSKHSNDKASISSHKTALEWYNKHAMKDPGIAKRTSEAGVLVMPKDYATIPDYVSFKQNEMRRYAGEKEVGSPGQVLRKNAQDVQNAVAQLSLPEAASKGPSASAQGNWAERTERQKTKKKGCCIC